MKKSKQRKWPENNVRQLRLAAGLTLEQLADRVEPTTNHDMIKKLELGDRELRRDWIKRIAKALHKEESDIIIASDVNKSLPDTKDTVLIDKARSQLDMAIKLWSNDESTASIQTLASEAYRIFRNSEPEITASSERLMMSSIISLQGSGKVLNNIEMRFVAWVSSNAPKSFGQEVGVYFSELFPVNGDGKLGKISKTEFFKETDKKLLG